MATPGIGILDTVLNNFRTQIDSGFSTLTAPVESSLGILIVISVATMAIMWAVDETHHIWGHLIRKVLLVGFWAYIITNWHPFSIALISGFGKLGIGAGGGSSGLSTFLNSPSQVFATGFKDAGALLDFARYCMGQTNGWGSPPSFDPITQIGYDLKQLVIFCEALIAAVILIVAYGWLALEVVVTVIEFHIVTLVAFCVLPFGVLSHTRSLAENAVGYVFRSGFKAMVLGLIIGLGSTFLQNNVLQETPGALPTLNTMCGLALSVLVILMLALNAPRYASAVITGSPSTGAGQLAGTAAAVGATAMLGARAGYRAVRAASGGGAGGGSGSGGGGSSEVGSADAARAASTVDSGGGSPGSSRPGSPSPAPSGGGSPNGPSSGGPGAAATMGPAARGLAADAALNDIAAAEAFGDASGSAPSSPADSPSPSPPSRRPITAWYATPVGVSSLTAPQLAAARSAYNNWSQNNPDLGARYSFESYVEYAQARHAESVTDASVQGAPQLEL